MGQRMFVAVQPPERVRDELADFLEAREGMPWIDRAQWHITLAFLASVADHRIDELAERLATAAVRRRPFAAAVAGAGAFPNPGRASVLWLGVEVLDGEPDPVDGRRETELHRLAVNARAAANAVGAPPDGKPFVPHLSLTRLNRPVEATKWLRVLDTFRSSTWPVEEFVLVASHLREGPSGRPRHETVATIPLGGHHD